MNLDLGSILVAALIGGVFGGLGGFVGFLMAKRFPSLGKLGAQIGTIIGVAISLFATDPIKAAFVGNSSQEAVADRQLQGASDLFRDLKAGWPSEYQAFIRQVAGTTDQATANRIAAEFTADLRRANAGYLTYADDKALVEVVVTSARFLRAVRQRDGDAVCAAVATTGPSTLGARAENYVAELEASGRAMFAALKSGRDLSSNRPPSIPPPMKQEDFDALDLFTVSRGGKSDLLARLSSPDNPDLCSDVLAFHDAAAEFELGAPRGRAARAALFYGLVAT